MNKIPDNNNKSEKIAIELAMAGANIVSVPIRLFTAGVNWTCNSCRPAEVVCKGVANIVNPILNGAGSLIPIPVKNFVAQRHALPGYLYSNYGIDPAYSTLTVESVDAIAIAAVTYGVGKSVGSIASSGIKTIRQNNAINRVVKAAVNDNHPFIQDSWHQVRNSALDLDFTSLMRTDKSMTIYVHGLGLKGAGNKGATFTTHITTHAQTAGAKSVYIQWWPANTRLFELAKNNKNFSYLGESSVFGDCSSGLHPTFKYNKYNKTLGTALVAYGLGSSFQAAFAEAVQQNGLSDSYNSCGPENSLGSDAGGDSGGEAGDIGGVGGHVGLIEGLFSHSSELSETTHAFYLPSVDGKQPFSEEELQQVMREVAAAEILDGTVGFFSLHFNSEHNMYPVIPPTLQNTLVGKVLGLLDYYMKGFLNGAFFDERYINEWQKSKTQDPATLKANCIDLHRYCQKELNASYFSIRELLDILEEKNRCETTEAKEANGIIENPLFSDYSAFRSSFRIIAKQNSFQKEGSLFCIDGDFDVFYTIEPDATYKEELEKYRQAHGKDPEGYKRLVDAYEIMRSQIKTMMPKLPHFKELFNKLYVINFLWYYFRTLKAHGKLPIFERLPIKASHCCPPLFPHLPIRKIHRQKVEVNFEKVLAKLCSDSIKKIEMFVTASHDLQSFNIPVELLKTLEQAFNEYLKEVITIPLSDEELKASSYKALIKNFLVRLHLRIQQGVKEKNEVINTLKDQQEKNEEDRKKFADALQSQNTEVAKCDQQLAVGNNNLNILNTQLRQASMFGGAAFQVIAQINTQIGQVNGAIHNISNEKKQMQVRASELQQILADINADKKNIEEHLSEVLKSPLFSICAAQFKMPIQTSFPIIQLFTEMAESEQNQTRRIVGGCGLNLQNLPLQRQTPLASSVYQNAQVSLVTSQTERFFPVKEMDRTKGFVFTLNLQDSQETNKEKQWLAFALTNPTLQEAVYKAALFSSIKESNIATFQKLIGKKKYREACDERGVNVLHYAAELQNIEYLQALVSRNATVDVADPLGYSALHYAARTGSIPALTFLLQNCPKLLSSTAKNGATALYVAIEYCQLEAVIYLLEQGADVNARVAHGMTPLYAAIHHGFEKIALELMKKPGVDLNSCLEDGTTAVFSAVRSEQIAIAKELLARGADGNGCRIDGMAPLHNAAKNGSFALCEMLLSFPSIQINLLTKSGKNALHLAVLHNNLSVIALLLKKGVDRSAKGWDKETPFLAAVRAGHFDAVNLLLENIFQEELLQVDMSGKTAINIALQYRFHRIVKAILGKMQSLPKSVDLLVALCQGHADPLEIKKYIEKHKFNVDEQKLAYHAAATFGHKAMMTYFKGVLFEDKSGWTPLHFAAKWDHFGFVEGKDDLLEQKNKEGKTAREVAAQYGSARTLAKLLALSDPKYLPSSELFHAASNCRFECVDLLLNACSADTGLDSEGTTAGHIAASRGDVELLNLLRGRGADFTLADKNGKTAFHYAFEYGFDEAVAYLMDRKWEFTLPEGLLPFAAEKASRKHLQILLSEGRSTKFFAHETGAIKNSLKKAIEADRYDNFVTLIDMWEGETEFYQELAILAVQNGRTPFVKHLFDCKSLTSSEQILLAAVNSGDEECVDFLYSRGCRSLQAAALARRLGFFPIAMIIEGQCDQLNKKKEAVVHSIQNQDIELFSQAIKDLPINAAINFSVDGKMCSWTLPILLCKLSETNLSENILFKILVRQPTLDLWAAVKDGQTIFHYCSANDFLELAGKQLEKALLRRDNDGVTPLHLLAGKANSAELKKILGSLKTKDLELNPADKNGLTPLHYAVLSKKQDNVALLLQHRADPNAFTNNRITPLAISCQQGSYLIAEILIRQGAEVNSLVTANKKMALHVACEQGCEATAKLLLANGAIVSPKDINGITPILLAAQKGNIALVRLLNAAGASLFEKDSSGYGLAHYAAESKSPRLLSELKIAGIDCNALSKEVKGFSRNPSSQKLKATPMQIAAREGNIKTLKWLLEQDYDIEALVEERLSILFFAAYSGSIAAVKLFERHKIMEDREHLFHGIKGALAKDSLEIVKFLLKRGISIDSSLNSSGRAALHYAVLYSAKRCTQYLVKKGADPLKIDGYETTPFALAVKSHQVAIANLLMNGEKRINIHQTLKEGNCYLHVACQQEDLEMASWLIEKGIRIDLLNDQGFAPLHIAAMVGNLPLLHLLLACGADLSKKSGCGKTAAELLPTGSQGALLLLKKYQTLALEAKKLKLTPLQTAIRLGDSRHLPLLIEICDINSTDRREKTALHRAIAKQNRNAALLLIEKGALLELQDHKGRTPLFIAATKVFDREMVTLLLDCGANIEAKDCMGESVESLLAKSPSSEKARSIQALIKVSK